MVSEVLKRRTRLMNAAISGHERDRVFWIIVALYLGFTAAKIAIATELDLFWDEAYHWQASTRLDVGYADKPFMTALLVRLGTLLAGDTRLGVRLVYLAIGAALPLAVYYLALPIVGRRDAVLAAGASLILPASAGAGLMAFQDTPMVLFMVVGLAAFERAVRTGRTAPWLVAGLMCALGVATHYRFAPFLFALFLYLVGTRSGRECWASKGLWLAAALVALGLLPLLIFNLRVDFHPILFHFMERNPWEFNPQGLRHPLEQALAVSPLLYLALLATLVFAISRARKGDSQSALLAISSATYLAVFFLLSPWSDRHHFTIHWPSPGYLPLLVLLPGMLRRLGASELSTAWGKARRALKIVVPATGALAAAALLYFSAAAAWPATLFPDLLHRIARNDLIKWSELAAAASSHLDRFGSEAKLGEGVVLVGGHYRIAAELDFFLRPKDEVFVLDHRRNGKDGLALQYALWDLQEASLARKRAGDRALIVIEEESYFYHSKAESAWLRGLCDVFSDLTYLGVQELSGGAKAFKFYAGRVNGIGERSPPEESGEATGFRPCATMPPAYIAQPRRGSVVRGTIPVFGWAVEDRNFDAPVPVQSVHIRVDGEDVGPAVLGSGWPEKHLRPSARKISTAPVGFEYLWDTTTLAEGLHQFAIRVQYHDGRRRDFGQRTVYVVRSF